MKYLKYLFHCISLTACLKVTAQVPVVQEPHHKTVLENNYVRLLDVHLNAGDTTQYHIHAAPSVIVFLSKSIMGAQLMGKAPAPPNEVSPGGTLFVDYGRNPVTHRVYNSGSNVFHVMDIELVKQQPSPDSCAAIQQTNIKAIINEKLVHVYQFNLSPNQSFTINESNCAHLLICISGKVNAGKQNMKTGDYIFFQPNTETFVSTQINSTCILLELK